MTTSAEGRRALFPISISVQITERCNLTCTHCAVDAGKHGARTWTEGMIFKLFSQLDSETPIIDITGGEPLSVWSTLSRCGREAADRGLLWGFTTNGTMLTSKHVCELTGMDVYAVKVSLDGLAGQHEAVRGPGTFASAIRAIDKLVEAGIPVGVQTAVSSNNQLDLPRLIDMLDVRGVSTIILFPLMPIGRQANQPSGVLSGQQLRELVLRLRAIETVQLRIHMELPQCGSLLNKASEDEEARCAAGYMVHLTASGEAWPCPVFPVSIGSLHNDPLEQIMEHPVLHNLRRRNGIGGHCADCPSMSLCGGGCRALAYTVGGEFNGPDPFCWEAIPNA